MAKFTCSECNKVEDRMETHHPGPNWKLLGLDIGKNEPIVICMPCYTTVGLGVVRLINGHKHKPVKQKPDRPLLELEEMAGID